MENRSVTPMRIAKTGYIVMSAVFCAAGVLFIVLPEQAAVAAGRRDTSSFAFHTQQ